MILLQAGKNQFGFDSALKKDNLEICEKNIFIAESPIMRKLSEQIKLVSDTDSPVLILGDSGTGRTRTAYEIFKQDKSRKEFMEFVCYSLDQNSIEENLFGDQGLLYKSPESTLFIKGIECLNSSLQSRFLSFLLNPLNQRSLPRLICSAGKNFPLETKKDSFLDSLFELLSENTLQLPSLLERKEDIPYFISYFNSQNAFLANFNEKALQILNSHSWEGNLKELKNICFQISVLHREKDLITENELNMLHLPEPSLLKDMYYEPKLTLEHLINHYIQLSLDHFQSKKRSAQALGISVKTIYNKIQKGDIAF